MNNIRWLNPFNGELNFKSSKHILLVVALICLMYGLYIAERLHRYPVPILTVDDISGYISESLFIKENGGILNFIPLCIQGKYPYANRQPLFLLMLSIFAERSLSFLVAARIFTMTTGLFFVFVFFFINNKLFNSLIALLSTFLLLRNVPFIQSSLSVNVEPLLMTAIYTFMLCCYRSVDDKRYRLIAGILAGISYMLKLSGVLLIGVYLIFNSRNTKMSKRAIRRLIPFFIGIVIFTSPLIIRNLVVFKTPVYDENTTMIWVDSTPEFLSLEANENPPTLSKYFKEHTLCHFIKRTFEGIWGYFNVFVRETLAVGIFEHKVPQIKKRSGLIVFVFMIAGIFLTKRKKLNVLMILVMILFFIPITLTYQVINPTRYLLPLMPFALLYASIGIVTVAQIVEKRLDQFRGRSPLTTLIVISLCLLLLIYPAKMFASVYGKDMQMIHTLPGYHELAEWATTHINEGDVYFAPLVVYHFELFSEELKEKSLTYPYIVAKYFLDKHKKGRYPLPLSDDFDKLNEYMRKHNAKYVMISGMETKAYTNVLNEYFTYNYQTGTKQVKPIENWELVFQSPESSPGIKVFRLKY